MKVRIMGKEYENMCNVLLEFGIPVFFFILYAELYLSLSAGWLFSVYRQNVERKASKILVSKYM